MKTIGKTVVVSLAVLLLVSGCSLLGMLFPSSDIYFWSMFDDQQQTRELSLPYRAEGYTIYMTRGMVEDQGYPTAAEAMSQSSGTVFTLTVDGDPQSADGPMYAAELGNGYHLVEDYTLLPASGQSYTIVGTLTIGGEEEDSRTLELTIR